MNLKEKLEGYKRNKTILLLRVGNVTFGQIEEVGDDYIVFRHVIIEDDQRQL
jgi:hypothetical protein